jgi:hypothetical protein
VSRYVSYEAVSYLGEDVHVFLFFFYFLFVEDSTVLDEPL